MKEDFKGEVVIVVYYNVFFYLYLKTDINKTSFSYLGERINNGEKLLMKDIYGWCNTHRIAYKTKYKYRKNMNVWANAVNFFFYIRGLIDNKKKLIELRK